MKKNKRVPRRYLVILLSEILLGAGLLTFAYRIIIAPNEKIEVKNPLTGFLLTQEEQVTEEVVNTDVVVFEQADPVFKPFCTENTNPANMIAETAIEVDGTMLEDLTSYAPESTIEFGLGEDYTAVNGIISFRGDNFRNSPAFGYANMSEYKLNGLWSKNTGALTYGSHTWTGSGWTGQPLMMKWPKEVKTHMNMYDWAKADD